MARSPSAPRVERLEVRAYRVPTELPEGDGTLTWSATTLVLVRLDAGGAQGLGYTYGSAAVAALVQDVLAEAVRGRDAFDVPAAHLGMQAALRNAGLSGAGMMALSAVDVALWDLKARLLGLPLASLLGRARERVPLYGSGGFTTYDLPTLERQLRGWIESGLRSVKMKIGADPDEDALRVWNAREAIGGLADLRVDANGAHTTASALALSEVLADLGVSWFEEPVSSEDLAGLALLRGRVPGGLRIAAGEYGDTAAYFRRMLQAGAVDVLQADATRCGGATGFLRAAAMARAFSIPFSAHCAPALHGVLGCAAEALESVEYFHDHVRVEALLFDGLPRQREAWLEPELSRPGLGLELKESDAERFRI
jgi:L-alanine-DL-glutamate epimerase-like enolase superfamily enzyme